METVLIIGFANWICKAWFDNIYKAVLGRLILLSLSRFSILLNTTVDKDTGTDWSIEET